jgi:hypothetical protein
VDGAGDQFLAGAAFAANQHGRTEGRDPVNLGQHLLHLAAGADDIVDLIVDLGDFLLQPELLAHHEPAFLGHGAVQAHGLADQIGHHGQKPDIAVEIAGRAVIADPVDSQDADALPARLDRHADQTDHDLADIASAGGLVQEQRFIGQIGHNRRHAGLQYPPDDTFAGAELALFHVFLGHAESCDQAQYVALGQQADPATPHLQMIGQHPQHFPQRLLQVKRRT